MVTLSILGGIITNEVDQNGGEGAGYGPIFVFLFLASLVTLGFTLTAFSYFLKK